MLFVICYLYVFLIYFQYSYEYIHLFTHWFIFSTWLFLLIVLSSFDKNLCIYAKLRKLNGKFCPHRSAPCIWYMSRYIFEFRIDIWILKNQEIKTTKHYVHIYIYICIRFCIYNKRILKKTKKTKNETKWHVVIDYFWYSPGVNIAGQRHSRPGVGGNLWAGNVWSVGRLKGFSGFHGQHWGPRGSTKPNETR